MDTIVRNVWPRLFLLALMLAGFAQAWANAQTQPGRAEVPVLTIEGAIGPATAGYVASGIARAAEQGAPMVIIRMDTPGGLDTSMREIIRAILGSPVPVVTYVSPSGARAASAGAFILTASHVAAMAPGTNVGAATPVQLGAPAAPSSPDTGDRQGDDKGNPSPAKSGGASEAKALNDAIAYIRSLAEMRGRNADWAEAAVRDAASLSAKSALERQVIDIVARDDGDLLAQIDGRVVALGNGQVRLQTAGLRLTEVLPDWRTRLREGRQALLVGLGFLTLCWGLGFLAVDLVPAPFGDFLNEGLLIIGWVANWRPAEIFLYDWRPMKRQGAVLDALAEMDVHFRIDRPDSSAESEPGAKAQLDIAEQTVVI